MSLAEPTACKALEEEVGPPTIVMIMSAPMTTSTTAHVAGTVAALDNGIGVVGVARVRVCGQ